MTYREIEGNLIELALLGEFDVVTHGCNCFCTMGAGIAVQMNRIFGCNNPSIFKLEDKKHSGNVNKLGCIEDHSISIKQSGQNDFVSIVVVNSYTQYYYGRKGYEHGAYNIPLDYDALTMCLRKINFKYPGRRIGLPKIGCTHGGGDWKRVRDIICSTLTHMDVTIVKLPK